MGPSHGFDVPVVNRVVQACIVRRYVSLFGSNTKYIDWARCTDRNVRTMQSNIRLHSTVPPHTDEGLSCFMGRTNWQDWKSRISSAPER